MATKCNNRLVGTTVLITFSIIILPIMLNGKKKYYQEEVAAIPLVSKTGNALKEQMWVVQLGALKNADKVSKIVSKLRLLGYQVYTLPTDPIQGQITRIFVGPYASKQKLQSVLSELNQLSALNGQLRPL
ncbi:SPOR domain-containing protein [Sodalis endosymbiont of Henestaris halophilus]|uniref:SPOR domain-containing protein n=1 Tax=Sodalis endosymbiont of Henestaris halophilus TaxID=1929246 RepID=UPI000BBF7946|nr:SPOR domain-containing protein [Sodalis endosymbiont of Henestaris halophilus]SNC58852.1 cell division protein DedD [Sodalis endosymbiont of Henestaris halophilus]